MTISARDQILDYLDGPKREDRYHRTALDDMRLGDVSTVQLQHYLASRRRLEEHLDEESVFDELCRLAMQADEETIDAFDRITQTAVGVGNNSFLKAEKLAAQTASLSTFVGIPRDRLTRIAKGMLEDGWTEDQVRYAIGTLGVA